MVVVFTAEAGWKCISFMHGSEQKYWKLPPLHTPIAALLVVLASTNFTIHTDQFLNICLKFTHLYKYIWAPVSKDVFLPPNFRHFQTQMISAKFPLLVSQWAENIFMFRLCFHLRTLITQFWKRKPEFALFRRNERTRNQVEYEMFFKET